MEKKTALQLAGEMTKHHEGLRLKPYHDPVGYPTIGYGHLLSRTPWEPLKNFDRISEEQAYQFLLEDLSKAASSVRTLCPVPLTEGQRAALIDFTFNVGGGNLQASTLRRLVNRGFMEDAANQFQRWVFARGVKLPGLVKRRIDERYLFENF